LSDTELNNVEIQPNRGVEYFISGGKRKQTQPFHIIFEKMVSFLSREVTIYFEFSFKIRNKKLISRRKKVGIS